MKDFMINVTDVVLHVAQPHVLRAEHKLSNKDFDFAKDTLANLMKNAQSSDEVLTYAYDMVRNEQRRADNDYRNYHIDSNEKLIAKMKDFLMSNLRSDVIVTRKSLQEAFCNRFEYGIYGNKDYTEMMLSDGISVGSIEAVTVIDEALRDLVKEDKKLVLSYFRLAMDKLTNVAWVFNPKKDMLVTRMEGSLSNTLTFDYNNKYCHIVNAHDEFMVVTEEFENHMSYVNPGYFHVKYSIMKYGIITETNIIEIVYDMRDKNDHI